MEMVELSGRSATQKNLLESPRASGNQLLSIASESSCSPLDVGTAAIRERNQNGGYQLESMQSQNTAQSVQDFMKDFKDSDVEGDGAATNSGSGSKVNGKLASPLKERSKQSKKMTVNTGKVYESDKESGSARGTYSSDGGYFDADDDSDSDDD